MIEMIDDHDFCVKEKKYLMQCQSLDGCNKIEIRKENDIYINTVIKMEINDNRDFAWTLQNFAFTPIKDIFLIKPPFGIRNEVSKLAKSLISIIITLDTLKDKTENLSLFVFWPGKVYYQFISEETKVPDSFNFYEGELLKIMYSFFRYFNKCSVYMFYNFKKDK